jgi:hypothetical protein
MAEHFVAMATKPDLVNGAGLVADRGGSGITLQGLRGVQSMAILPQFAQQSRRDFGAGPRERAEQVMVGVLSQKAFRFVGDKPPVASATPAAV